MAILKTRMHDKSAKTGNRETPIAVSECKQNCTSNDKKSGSADCGKWEKKSRNHSQEIHFGSKASSTRDPEATGTAAVKTAGQRSKITKREILAVGLAAKEESGSSELLCKALA